MRTSLSLWSFSNRASWKRQSTFNHSSQSFWIRNYLTRPSSTWTANDSSLLNLAVRDTLDDNSINNDLITIMPEPPYTFGSLEGLPVFDLSDLGAQVAADDDRRKAAGDLNRRLQVAYTKAKTAAESNATRGEQQVLMDNMKTFLHDPLLERDRNPRLSSLSYRMEDYARLSAFCHFLSTAELWPPPSPNDKVPLTDEEYLAGACMGLAQDLSRYGLGRATVRDVASVTAAKELVAQILDYLLQFDFRNGPLRRKYDGVKYALQALERLLYELSVTENSSQTLSERAAKKARSEKELVPELAALKKRMEHRDELREKLIKQCRDGQKAAKQAIYALHRGDKEKAKAVMDQCEACIKELIPTIQEEPPLRLGSFANVVEEYVEAKLFAAWLEPNADMTASGKILVPADFTVLALQPDEYLGGLCDLTGEIGRYAVQRGTKRDVDGVRLCLHSNQRILAEIQSMPVFPSGIGKKMDQLRRSVEKLERILYELSLSEAAGGRPIHTEVESGAPNDNE